MACGSVLPFPATSSAHLMKGWEAVRIQWCVKRMSARNVDRDSTEEKGGEEKWRERVGWRERS